MGRALEAVRNRDLPRLFAYFGIDADPQALEANAVAIGSRFAQEAEAIARLCARLRERERFQLLRAALRQAYERALLHQTASSVPG
jgi:hypothetical protein